MQLAEAANVAESVVGPLRQQAVAGLDRLYGVITVRSEPAFTFVPAEGGEPSSSGP